VVHITIDIIQDEQYSVVSVMSFLTLFQINMTAKLPATFKLYIWNQTLLSNVQSIEMLISTINFVELIDALASPSHCQSRALWTNISL